MSFILTVDAALRVMAAQQDDPLVAWLEADEIKPFIDWATMASVRFEIRTNPAIAPDQKSSLERRYQKLQRDLTRRKQHQISSIGLDSTSAGILSDLLSIDAGMNQHVLSDIDLVPAAIAIQHNLQLVVTNYVQAWQELSGAIPKPSGRLLLNIFDRASG